MIQNLLRKVKHVFPSLLLVCLLVLCSFPCYADDDSSVRVDPVQDPVLIQSVDTEVLRISANNTSGLHSVILSLIGDYNPIAVTTAYQYPSGTGYTTRYQVDVEPDWSWILTCSLFIVVVFCTFKFIGGIFTK